MTEVTKIQPRPTAVSQPFWDGCADHELRLQFCQTCSQHQFYPRIMCASCGGQNLTWQRATGKGTVASFTIVRRGVSQAYEGPYVVALIDLEEGPRIMSQIVMADPDSGHLRIGASVTAIFEPWSEETTVVLFELNS